MPKNDDLTASDTQTLLDLRRRLDRAEKSMSRAQKEFLIRTTAEVIHARSLLEANTSKPTSTTTDTGVQADNVTQRAWSAPAHPIRARSASGNITENVAACVYVDAATQMTHSERRKLQAKHRRRIEALTKPPIHTPDPTTAGDTAVPKPESVDAERDAVQQQQQQQQQRQQRQQQQPPPRRKASCRPTPPTYLINPHNRNLIQEIDAILSQPRERMSFAQLKRRQAMEQETFEFISPIEFNARTLRGRISGMLREVREGNERVEGFWARYLGWKGDEAVGKDEEAGKMGEMLGTGEGMEDFVCDGLGDLIKQFRAFCAPEPEPESDTAAVTSDAVSGLDETSRAAKTPAPRLQPQRTYEPMSPVYQPMSPGFEPSGPMYSPIYPDYGREMTPPATAVNAMTQNDYFSTAQSPNERKEPLPLDQVRGDTTLALLETPGELMELSDMPLLSPDEASSTMSAVEALRWKITDIEWEIRMLIEGGRMMMQGGEAGEGNENQEEKKEMEPGEEEGFECDVE